MPQDSNMPSIFNPLSRNPFRNLRTMQQEMDRWFDEMLNGSALSLESGQTFSPTCDIEETDHQYILNFDLPGVKREDLKVDLRNNVLTVSGERKEQREKKEKKNYRSERFYGTYQRSFTLPNAVKPEQIEANFSDGVLSITIPKTEEMKASQIKIGGERMSSKAEPKTH